jgi:hypothetical protein
MASGKKDRRPSPQEVQIVAASLTDFIVGALYTNPIINAILALLTEETGRVGAAKVFTASLREVADNFEKNAAEWEKKEKKVRGEVDSAIDRVLEKAKKGER